MRIKELLWKIGLLGDKCPLCKSDMVQRGFNKPLTKFVCTNPKCGWFEESIRETTLQQAEAVHEGLKAILE